MDREAIVRNLAPADVLSVFLLGQRIFDWRSENILWRRSLVQWYCDNASSLSFVAEYEETIVGMVLCFAREETGYVGWLAVEAQWRRQGIGTQLIQEALIAFQSMGIREMTAIVREDGRADRLLEQIGFRNTRLRKVDMTFKPSKSPRDNYSV